MKVFSLIIGLFFSTIVFGQDKGIGCSSQLMELYFNKGEFELDDFGKKYLDTVAIFLKENQNVIFVISGYADSKGDSNYNLKLSKKRAKSVAYYLRQSGVKKRRLKVKWYGETRLTRKCRYSVEFSEEINRLNRRVEFELIFPEE